MKRYGFTLIELLVVIAIIAILAAIAFPVIGRAKDSAYKSSDLNNMNSLRSALQIYRADQGAYPAALLGYVTNKLVVPYAGRVVRYTRATPENIAARKDIRERGLALLTAA